ncbi:MAG: class I tRNA ligase family protein, partial [bacterium]|nr:class I tRNA ligase family protein [bacterium]
IRDVTNDFNKIHFNTATSFIRVLVNAIYKRLETENVIPKKVLEVLAKLLAPMTPHLSEELWSLLGYSPSIFDTAWEIFDESLIKTEMVEVVIQVNGKIRSKIEVEAGISESKLKDLARTDEKIQKYLEGKDVKKVIVVPNKLVSFVVI